MLPLTQKQEDALATLQQGFAATVSATGLNPGEVCKRLLDGAVALLGAVNLEGCRVSEFLGNRVQVTFAAPVANVPASLVNFKWRSPSNVAIVDGKGNWTGVEAYFREWRDFVEAAMQYVNAFRAHAANF